MTKKQEGDGYAKPQYAWAVEVDGKIDAVHFSRQAAREDRTYITDWNDEIKAHVRKIKIEVVKGR